MRKPKPINARPVDVGALPDGKGVTMILETELGYIQVIFNVAQAVAASKALAQAAMIAGVPVVRE